MSTRKITAEYRLSQWAQIIQARNESGKSVKDFCEDAGVNKNAYFYWQRKLREAACKDLTEADVPSIRLVVIKYDLVSCLSAGPVKPHVTF